MLMLRLPRTPVILAFLAAFSSACGSGSVLFEQDSTVEEDSTPEDTGDDTEAPSAVTKVTAVARPYPFKLRTFHLTGDCEEGATTASISAHWQLASESGTSTATATADCTDGAWEADLALEATVPTNSLVTFTAASGDSEADRHFFLSNYGLANNAVYAQTTVTDVEGNTSLYFGGEFTSILSRPLGGVAAFDESLEESGLSSLGESLQGDSGANVEDVAVLGDWIYVATFAKVFRGEALGPVVKIHAVTGEIDMDFKNGTPFELTAYNNANALAVDSETGSLYVGGDFRLKGATSTVVRLVKLSAETGAQDTDFSATLDDDADSLALSAGGLSVVVGNNDEVSLLDKATGATASGFPVTVSGPEEQLATEDGIYVGTSDGCTKINFAGATSPCIAAGTDILSSVAQFARVGSTIYVAGEYTDASGNYLPVLRFDASTGVVDTSFGADFIGSEVSGWGIALASDSESAFLLAGSDTLHRISLTDGSILASLGGSDDSERRFNQANGLHVSHGSVIALGPSAIGGTPANRLAKVDAETGIPDFTFLYASGDVATFDEGTDGFTNPSVSGTVRALVATDDGLYVGGDFTSYRGNLYVNGIARIDPETGALDTAFAYATPATPTFTDGFRNGAGDASVRALAVDADGNVYAGGKFSTYRGASYVRRLAKVNASGTLNPAFTFANGTSGATTDGVTWTASANSTMVHALAVSGTSLYVGGYFNTYRTSTASPNHSRYLLKVSTTDGTRDTTFNCADGATCTSTDGFNQIVYALAVSGTDVYAGGGFTSYRDQTQVNRLAKLSGTTGALDTSFAFANPASPASSDGMSDTVYSLLVSDDTLYVGGYFTSYRGSSHVNRLAAVSTTDGALDATFAYSDGATGQSSDGMDSEVNSLSLLGSRLLVGGSLRSYRGWQSRYGLSIDALTGVPWSTDVE